jgi:hypothetical protein
MRNGVGQCGYGLAAHLGAVSSRAMTPAGSLSTRVASRFASNPPDATSIMTLLLLFLLPVAGTQAGVEPDSAAFDFNSYTAGHLVGQDGWQASPGVVSPWLQTGGGVNPTLAPAGGAGANDSGVDHFALHTGGGPGGSLGVGGTPGRFVALQMDARSWPINWAVTGLGQRSEAGSIFTGFTYAFFFGIADGSVWMAREGTGALAAAEFGDLRPSYDLGDWCQVQMLVDLGAYQGDGAGSLAIRNLTDGQAAFLPVPGCQNINLQLLTCPVPDATQWDALGIWTRSAYGGNGAVDNVAYQVVPEPAAVSLLALGILALGGSHLRRPAGDATSVAGGSHRPR